MDINGIKISGPLVRTITSIEKEVWNQFFEDLKQQEYLRIPASSEAEHLQGVHFRLKKISEIENIFKQVIDHKAEKN